MFERLKQTADAIKKRYLGHGKGSVLIVSHAGPIIALSRAIVDNPHLPVRTGVCSISKFEQIDGKWVQVLNGDCSHLTSGETNHWEFPEDRKREKN
jgi:broad specificity phosphatase PhoE